MPIRADAGPAARSDLWFCPPPCWGRWIPLEKLSPRRRKKHRFLRVRARALQHLLVASCIKWKLTPSFDPSSFLTDPVVKETFRNPDFVRRPKDTWPALPKAIVHVDKSEILELAGKWDNLDAYRVIECSQVASIETMGLFCVPKDA